LGLTCISSPHRPTPTYEPSLFVLPPTPLASDDGDTRKRWWQLEDSPLSRACVARDTHIPRTDSASETTMRWTERCAEYTPTAGWWVLSPWVQQSVESEPTAGRWVLSPGVEQRAESVPTDGR
jgi:hypothetical protein